MSATQQQSASAGGDRPPPPSDKPPRSCGICWSTGHFAKDCKNKPHPRSQDTWAIKRWNQAHPADLVQAPQQASVAQEAANELWKGRGSAQAMEASAEMDELQAYRAYFAHQAPRQQFAQWAEQQEKPRKKTKRAAFQAAFTAEHFALGTQADPHGRSESSVLRGNRRPMRPRSGRKPEGRRESAAVRAKLDSACTGHMAPIEEVEGRLFDCVEVQGESVKTAGREDSLEIMQRGSLAVSAKTELNKDKDYLLESVMGVKDLRTWLLSVFEMVQKGHVIHFAPELDGGSWVQLKNSEERLPVVVEERSFVLPLTVIGEAKTSLKQKQEINFETHVKMGHLGHRVLAETQRRKMVRNMEYYPNVEFGHDTVCLSKKGQKAPFNTVELPFRPKVVGARVVADCKGPINVRSINQQVYMVTFRDVASSFRKRFHVRSLHGLHSLVHKFQRLLARRGFPIKHFHADGQFETDELYRLAAGEYGGAPFDVSFSPPECQSLNGAAENDVKHWTQGVRSILDEAQTDANSVVSDKFWNCASEVFTDIENMTFCANAPEMTPWERVMGQQPDAAVWQRPLARVWFYIYPTLRSGPWVDRRAEGVFCGYSAVIRGYRILNLATKRYITRRVEDCVFDRTRCLTTSRP